MSLDLTLPYPPSVNSLYRSIVRGKFATVIISKKGRQYFATVQGILNNIVKEPMEGDLQVWLEAYPPDKRRRDIDNLLKAVFDSLQKSGIILDDSQIKSVHARMLEKRTPAAVDVRIEPL